MDEFFERAVSLDFVLFPPAAVAARLADAGSTDVEVVERGPCPRVEYPGRRACVFATRR